MTMVRFTEEQLTAHRERLRVSMEQAGARQESGGSEAITLLLPWPVSANKYWRSFVPKGQTRALVVLSDEAKAYKVKVKAIARAAGISTPITGRVELDVRLYPARPKDWVKRAQRDPGGWDNTVQSIDLDNALKVTIDALKDNVIEDDRFVWRIEAERMEPSGEARMVVTVRSLAPRDVPQLGLGF